MSENTNAGGGERYTVPTADHRRRIQAIGAAISRRDWNAVEQAHAEIRDAFDRPDIYDPAALSAQSTGSGGVAAEPVAWDGLRKIERLLTNLQPHISQACYPERAGFIDNYVQPALDIARAALAAAPTPPAGGGETNKPDPVRLLKDALFACLKAGFEEKEYGGVLVDGGRFAHIKFWKAEPSSASPAGDLNSLSAGATPGTLSVSGSRRRYNEPSCVIVDASSCSALFALATGERGKDALQSLADAKFLVGLWNAYREGRLVEKDTGKGRV